MISGQQATLIEATRAYSRSFDLRPQNAELRAISLRYYIDIVLENVPLSIESLGKFCEKTSDNRENHRN